MCRGMISRNIQSALNINFSLDGFFSRKRPIHHNTAVDNDPQRGLRGIGHRKGSGFTFNFPIITNLSAHFGVKRRNIQNQTSRLPLVNHTN